jgi:signal transduction histidine kinase
LFQFGVELLKPRWPRLLVMPLLVVVGWGFWFILPGIAFSTDLHTWHFQASIWARYLIGFPGGVSAALGLRYQADRQIKPLNLKKIYQTLQLAGGALLMYAVLGGLVVPVGEFFPANWLNHANFTAWFGVSPPVLRSLTGLVLAVSIIQALEVFNIENDQLIERMEIEQSLMEERERIGRELHDSTIQTIYTAGLLVEAAHAKLSQPELAGQRLERAMETLNEAIAGLRTYIGGLQPDSTFLSLPDGIRHIADDLRLTALANIHHKIDLPPEAQLEPARVHHLLAIVREALSNATRHAQAQSIVVKVLKEKNTLIVSVEDDGCGFAANPGSNGYGLQNMRDRANLLGGQLKIDSRPGQGVTVRLRVPWEIEG